MWTFRYRGVDFVGVTAGNGGNLQSAISYDVAPHGSGQSNEEENPTEAGNVHDRDGRTSSRWLAAAASPTEMYTKCQMAYYYPPGEVVASSPRRNRARGVGVLSDTTLEKRVTIGYRFKNVFFKNVVRFQLRFSCPSKHWFTQVEILTGYMPRSFTRIYAVQNGKALLQNTQQYSRGPPARPHPIILASSPQTAIGILCDAYPRRGTYPTGAWYSADTITHRGANPLPPHQEVQFSKWNVVWHGGNQNRRSATVPKVMEFSVCMVVGSVAECASVIERLSV